MKGLRDSTKASNRSVGAAIGMLGVVALVGFGSLAALPGTGAALRIVFVVLGYVCFVAFFRARDASMDEELGSSCGKAKRGTGRAPAS